MDYLNTNEIRTLKWPACSPDLNPIENLWGLIVRDVYLDNKQYATVNELKIAILNAWSRIDVQVLNNLAMSIPRRLLSVVKNAGGVTK